jgi:hypothetical protein
MSFTRRMKYGNKMALRKLKNLNLDSSKVDTIGFLFVCTVVVLTMNLALTNM